MSELQLGLVAVGALVIVGVLVYNRVQVGRAQRAADAAFKSGHADVLMGGGDGSGGEVARTHEARHHAGERAQPAGDAALPDARLDYVIELTSASAVPATSLLEHWDALARRFRDRVLVSGAAGDAWRPIAHGDRAPYGQVRAGLQLVNRAGVAGEAEVIEFRSEVENFAARLGFHAASPEMKAALEEARMLDAFCAERDIQAALHVVAQDADGFAVVAILDAAGRHGLAPDGHGRFASADAAGRTLFTLSDRGGARLDAQPAAPVAAISLTMDVPRAPDTRRSFEAMARAAQALAGELQGRLVDDNGNALDERALGAIEAELARVAAELSSRGFVPGEALALRLFS